ncbi:MAG: hypothetical protein KF829_00255 [Ferruginibacter sp.]|nr:hypothetical protein [Ferruginibacter sp.]
MKNNQKKIPYSKELANWFVDWLNLSTSEKFNQLYSDYQKKFPSGSYDEFLEMEGQFQKEAISELEKKGTKKKWWEAKLLIETKKILQYILSKSPQPQQTVNYPAKFYALYHWLKIEMGTEKPFPKNDNGQFVKSEIEAYATSKYPYCSKQGFYRSFKDLDITNRTAIANSFGNGYKETLVALSDNDNKLTTHLKNYPN